MIVWQGFGILVALVGVFIYIAVDKVTAWLSKDPTYLESHGWTKLIALWLCAIAIWSLAKYFDSRPGKIVIEKETGKEIELKQKHTLFFAPMRYWAYGLGIFGVISLFIK